jgi:hypothetical protein
MRLPARTIDLREGISTVGIANDAAVGEAGRDL